MGCILSCVGSCLGTACAKAICGSCNSKGSRVPYLVIMFLMTVLALILRYWGGPILIDMYVYTAHLCDEACFGYAAVYRLSFVLFSFFTIMFLFCLGKGGIRVDSTMWGGKFLFFLVWTTLAFFLPNDFYEGYAHVARVFSGVFLFLQIVILIDFAERWNENWVQREWLAGTLVVALVNLCGCFALLIFFFKWYDDKDEDCGLEKFYISITLIGTFVATGISVTEWCNHGSLLTSSVVTTYCYWLLYSALSSDPSSCNNFNSNSTFHLIFGLLVGAGSVTYAGYNLATNSENLFSLSDDEGEIDANNLSKALNPSSAGDAQDPASATGDSKASSPRRASAKRRDLEERGIPTTELDLEEGDEEVGAEEEQVRKRLQKFHGIMAVSAMYMSMLLCNWGDAQQDDRSYDISDTTMWIKIVTQWVTIGMYIWSLLMPYTCGHQEE